MQKELKFLHITKTGGTTIENIANSKGIKWGRYHLTGRDEMPYWHDDLTVLPPALKQKYDWFAVVRNPYDRIISEYHCPWMGTSKKTHTISDFNASIIKLILQRAKFSRKNGGGHYREQWRYIDNLTNVHILKFETLQTDFDALMLKYGLDLKLGSVYNNRGLTKKFSVDDLSPAAIRLINEVYRKDFFLFGYKFKMYHF